jgi:26S proteasome regulatory subunit N9
MSFDAKTQAILSFLQAQAAAAPELAGEYAQMEDLYKRKLWHQLTCVLEAFMVLPAAASHLVPLFETFVKDFKHKLNKMALARIQMAMAHQMKDVDEVTAFCQAAAEDAAKEEAQASSFILSELARIQLAADRVEACKTQLDKAAEYMEAAGASNAVQAAFYRAWVAYYKVKGPAHEFYSHALLLLAYRPLSQMPREEQVTLSFDMGIAALVGENLYNFGELLEHPVIGVLQETEFAWLAHLLRAFNAGDIAQYEVLVAAHHTQLEAQPALLQNTNFLKEKITLMCLTETLFQRIGPAADRSVSFDDIAVASKLPRNQVRAAACFAPTPSPRKPRRTPTLAPQPNPQNPTSAPRLSTLGSNRPSPSPGRAPADARALAAAHPRQASTLQVPRLARCCHPPPQRPIGQPGAALWAPRGGPSRRTHADEGLRKHSPLLAQCRLDARPLQARSTRSMVHAPSSGCCRACWRRSRSKRCTTG